MTLYYNMNSNKRKKVLWVGESSLISTGYATYGKEVLSRLYKTGKYEIAELACYGHYSNVNKVPWKYYGVLPDSKEHDGEYRQVTNAQWGALKFEEVCVDFKPDIVIDIRDVWMIDYQQKSPFRKMFHWAIMPAVDSLHQKEQWIDTYVSADSVLAYCEFGRDTMLEESNNNINFCGLAPPAANEQFFRPVQDKKEHKKSFGFSGDVKIVGTIMRNQSRKLFPDLIKAFRIFLEKNDNVTNNTYLYLHTSYPDIGWDIPALIKESGIANKIICTYMCEKCGFVFFSLFGDAIQQCRRCKRISAKMPNAKISVPTPTLAYIINTFDVYVQYANCEGLGMPAVEAAACGVPVMEVDYSGMASVLKSVKGTPIKVERFFTEVSSGLTRAYPDNQDFANKLHGLLRKNLSDKSRDTYLSYKKNFSWDKSAKKWEEIIDKCDFSNKWNDPPNTISPKINDIPKNLNNADFVRWCFCNILGKPEEMFSYTCARIIRDLNYGQASYSDAGLYHSDNSINNKTVKIGREEVVRSLLAVVEKNNHNEQLRCGLIKKETPQYILAGRVHESI